MSARNSERGRSGSLSLIHMAIGGAAEPGGIFFQDGFFFPMSTALAAMTGKLGTPGALSLHIRFQADPHEGQGHRDPKIRFKETG